MIKLEVAFVPAYERVVQPLQVNYPALPASYDLILLPVESLQEIMADKLVSLPTAKGIRYRDIWDLYWIANTPPRTFDKTKALVMRKVNDYGVKDYGKQVSKTMDILPRLVESRDLLVQMQRFISKSIMAQTLALPEFRTYFAKLTADLLRPLLNY